MKHLYVFNTLRRQRKLFLLTQEEVTEKIKVGSKRMSSWENGWSKPNRKNLRALCQLFKTTPAELYPGLWSEFREATPTKIICGLSLGTRFIGLTIMYRSKLLYWRSFSFQGKWSKKKQRHILQRIQTILVRRRVSVILLKKIDPRRSSPRLDLLVDGVTSLARKSHTPLFTVHLNTLKFHWLSGEKSSLKRLVDAVWEKYPELCPQHKFRITPIPKDAHRVFLAAALARRHANVYL